MSKSKKILLGSMLGLAVLSVASCTDKNVRNTTTPTYTGYSADAVIAKNGETELKANLFYNRLRSKSYDVFTSSLKKNLYAAEFAAAKQLISTDYENASADLKKNLNWNDGEISKENYDKLKKEIIKELNNSFATAVFSTTSASKLAGYTEKQVNEYLNKYYDTTNRRNNGTKLTKNDYSYNINTDLISFKIGEADCKVNENELNDYLISVAENLYARKELNTVATSEIIKDDDGNDVKNQYYIFENPDDIKDNDYKSDLYEKAYDATYKTYGTYKAIIVQFNSKAEADLTMNNLGMTLTDDNADTYYRALYETYYSYRDLTNEDKDFTYTISEDKNELQDLSTSISVLVSDTLNDGDYLKEPRNIDNKYVMAYRVSTEYQYPNNNESNEKKAYKDLTAEERKEIIPNLQYNLIKTNSTSYANKAFQQAIKNSDLQIYDPFFEYKFQYQYSDSYEVINAKDFNGALIYKLGDKEYTVDEFYNDAKNKYAAGIISDFFQLEFAHKYAVDNDKVNTTKVEENEKSLTDAISQFEKNSNTTYPSEIGLETYLLASYGYTNKDDVLNYYYNYNSQLTDYKAQVLFESWAKENTGDDKETRPTVMSDKAVSLFETLLNTGKDDYDTLFSMNVDHILINIDDDGDGSPDDPDLFLEKLPEEKKQQFENAVSELAQEIYTEALYIYNKYTENSLYKVLSFVKDQYNKGAQLENPDAKYKTWKDFKTSTADHKTYNFLLTVEQLASSGDITQTSVSNFVTPFADYLKGLQSDAKERYKDDFKNDKLTFEKGTFYIYDENDANNSGKLTDAKDATKINANTLCKTVYGYHLIVLNSVKKPEYFTFDSSDDSNKVKQHIELLLDEKDKDDDKDNVLVYASIWNEKNDGKDPTTATVEQLFVYYVQSKNNATTSFTDTVKTLISSIYDEIFTKFTSTNFRTYLLLDSLNIECDDELKALYNAEKDYYKHSVYDYDETSKYFSWVDNAELLTIFKNSL